MALLNTKPVQNDIKEVSVDDNRPGYPFRRAFDELAKEQNALADALFAIKNKVPLSRLRKQRKQVA